MSELILHQGTRSPFSEKIRLVLGYKKLAWKAVAVPAGTPGADVAALTGGYCKTPFLQVGADIYCDSALICDVLEHVQGEPTLYPPHLKGVSRVFAQWADTTLSTAAVAYNRQPKGAAPDATSALRSYLRRIAHMVEEHEFLFGTEPCVADFSTYHPLWYTRSQATALADILSATPAVAEWMDRLAAIGHGSAGSLSPADAIAVAQAAEPMPPGQNLLLDSAFQDDHGIRLGSRVRIAAETLGTEATEGELIAATRTHYSLRREDERCGLVHVHFPRIGYLLRALDSPAAAGQSAPR